MSNPIVILGKQGSRFGPALAEAISSRGTTCDLRSLDAALEGSPVRVDDTGVVWDGLDLTRARVLFLEQPLFSWPQPSTADDLSPDPAIRARQITRQREVRALTISSVLIAADHLAVINRPGAGALTASRPVALTHLEAAGIPVHPWTMKPAPEADATDDVVILDLIGAERWHVPERPPAGDPCLALSGLSGEIHGVLVAGGAVAGARRYPSAAAWVAQRAAEVVGKEMVAAAAQLAVAAAAALDLEMAEVWIGGGARPVVLLMEGGPDLEEWDRSLRGRVVEQIAGRLIDLAASSEGGSS